VDLSPRALIDQARSPTGKTFLKYSAVSVISVAINLVLLVFAFGVSAIPSYYLNRAWAWQKRGKSHFLKEVVPFWALAFLGLVVSTIAVHFVGNNIKQYHHAVQTLIVAATNIGAFGILWVGKFIIFNELMFKQHPEVLEDEPALDGRAGIPG